MYIKKGYSISVKNIYVKIYRVYEMRNTKPSGDAVLTQFQLYNLLFRQGSCTHSRSFCWRTGGLAPTPVPYAAQSIRGTTISINMKSVGTRGTLH